MLTLVGLTTVTIVKKLHFLIEFNLNRMFENNSVTCLVISIERYPKTMVFAYICQSHECAVQLQNTFTSVVKGNSKRKLKVTFDWTRLLKSIRINFNSAIFFYFSFDNL